MQKKNSEIFAGSDPTHQLTGNPVRHMDGSALLRPQKIQGGNLIVAGIFIVIALIIGCIFSYKAIDVAILSQQRSVEQMQENVTRNVKYNTPKLQNYIAKSDDSIISTLKGKKYKMYFIDESKGEGFDLVKFPGDMKKGDAEALFLEGIDNLDPADAGMLLNGMWRFTVDRTNTPDMRIRYADFRSGSVEEAIQEAVEAQGFAKAKVTDTGTDTSGNTYQEGTITIDKKKYTWRVSALPLNEVYSVDLPETAVYVGIRLTKNA